MLGRPRSEKGCHFQHHRFCHVSSKACVVGATNMSAATENNFCSICCLHVPITCVASRAERAIACGGERAKNELHCGGAKRLRLQGGNATNDARRARLPAGAWLAGCVGKRTKSLLFEGKETRQKHSGVGRFPYSVRTLPSSPALARNHRPASPTLWGTSVVVQRTSLPTNTALCRSSIARPPR